MFCFRLKSQVTTSNRNDDFDFADADIDNTVLEDLCQPEPVCNPNDKFRTIDGSCNNLDNPKYGTLLDNFDKSGVIFDHRSFLRNVIHACAKSLGC